MQCCKFNLDCGAISQSIQFYYLSFLLLPPPLHPGEPYEQLWIKPGSAAWKVSTSTLYYLSSPSFKKFSTSNTPILPALDQQNSHNLPLSLNRLNVIQKCRYNLIFETPRGKICQEHLGLVFNLVLSTLIEENFYTYILILPLPQF